MKEADLDWLVYHLILDDPGITADALARSAGCEMEEVCSSLGRLTRYLLIEQQDQGFRALSTSEMLVRCQCTYDQACSFTIENGVVRVKKREGE